MEIIKNQDFLLRRLHSLFGIIPLGVFIFEHFFINSFALIGPQSYNDKVAFLRSLPYLQLIEWGGIFIPLLIHIILGLIIIYQGKPNLSRYKYSRNWMYVLQRYTALITLGFLTFHILSLRFYHNPDVIDFFSLLREIFKQPGLAAIYIIGSGATIFHFCNGICTFLMSWGVTVTPHSQRVVSIFAILLGIVLFAVIINSVLSFLT